MADGGEEKLIAVARHIAKTLGHTDTMTDDILQIFSTFDRRFSRENLSDHDNHQNHNHNSHDSPRLDRHRDLEDPRSVSALDASLKSLARQISLYVLADHPIWSDSADASAFLDAVDQLLSTFRDWSSLAAHDKSVASCLHRADDLLQDSVFKLQEEFKSLMDHGADSFDLSRRSNYGDSTRNYPYDEEDGEDEDDDAKAGEIPVAQPVTDFNIVIDALPSGTIGDLHEIAKRMVEAEYGKECSHVYGSCRHDFLEESLSRLGLQKLSIEEVQKAEWSDLEEQIERWSKAANLTLRVLFPSERRLCDRVFSGFPNAADRSFMKVCRGSAIQLLNFADAIAISSRSPERLFKVLDVYETLRDLMPDFELLFSDPFCVSLRNEAITIWKRVGDCIRVIFMQLENLIRQDPAKVAVRGGTLHPITRYVVNYLKAACRSYQTLEQVFEDSIVSPGDYRNLQDDRSSSTSSLSVQISWIMELLESNLEVKSKLYKDAGLSCVFLMNNGRYIVKKVKDSELGMLLGEDWIRKHNAKVKQLHGMYQRSSWVKLLGLLKIDSTSSAAAASNAAAPKSLKERLRMFNVSFDELCKAQSNWVIFDDQLREEIKISVTGNLLPAYRSFIGRFEASHEAGRNAEKYIKYSVEDLEARIINELFQGINEKK
ncbi:hypothetical protein Droror1_Dr00019056 [Drosera rotundifolia]